jgi:dimethylaniline monooxygenase (N-oxide forming)
MFQLVSSKYLTAFSDFRFSPTDADFVSTRRFCQYLEDYATNFKLWPHISLDTDVTSVRRTLSGGHVITFTKDGKSEEWECDAVAVCSGLHVNPDIPEIPGIENVPKVMHSSQFKTRADFGEGTNVMVLGAGETAMDVSHLAVTSPTKSVTMCHRDGWFYAPKVNR